MHRSLAVIVIALMAVVCFGCSPVRVTPPTSGVRQSGPGGSAASDSGVREKLPLAR